MCTLVMNPNEGPLGGLGFPEIVDLTVFFNVHNKGIGNKLMDVAEQEAAKVSDAVYLAVGVHSGYGAAQRIYVGSDMNRMLGIKHGKLHCYDRRFYPYSDSFFRKDTELLLSE